MAIRKKCPATILILAGLIALVGCAESEANEGDGPASTSHARGVDSAESSGLPTPAIFRTTSGEDLPGVVEWRLRRNPDGEVFSKLLVEIWSSVPGSEAEPALTWSFKLWDLDRFLAAHYASPWAGTKFAYGALFTSRTDFFPVRGGDIELSFLPQGRFEGKLVAQFPTQPSHDLSVTFEGVVVLNCWDSTDTNRTNGEFCQQSVIHLDSGASND